MGDHIPDYSNRREDTESHKLGADKVLGMLAIIQYSSERNF
jgi:hypothetical protein